MRTRLLSTYFHALGYLLSSNMLYCSYEVLATNFVISTCERLNCYLAALLSRLFALKLHAFDLLNLYSSPNMITLRWTSQERWAVLNIYCLRRNANYINFSWSSWPWRWERYDSLSLDSVTFQKTWVELHFVRGLKVTDHVEDLLLDRG
jgi:hypothetical protein